MRARIVRRPRRRSPPRAPAKTRRRPRHARMTDSAITRPASAIASASSWGRSTGLLCALLAVIAGVGTADALFDRRRQVDAVGGPSSGPVWRLFRGHGRAGDHGSAGLVRPGLSGLRRRTGAVAGGGRSGHTRAWGPSAGWIIGPVRLQPSEIIKIGLVLALARFYHSLPGAAGGPFLAVADPGGPDPAFQRRSSPASPTWARRS